MAQTALHTATYPDGRSSQDRTPAPKPRTTIAAVAYLNAAPLVWGLERLAEVAVRTAPPASLLGMLLEDAADVALAPVIDALRSPEPMALLPVGGIACEDRASTVMLYAQRPFEELEEALVDAESHTSAALLQLLLRRRWGVSPSVKPFDAAAGVDWEKTPAALLIGDKVRTHAPSERTHPHRLDLGRAWREMTGLPFVFACWMCTAERAESEAVALAAWTLDRQRRRNALRLDAVACAQGPRHGWSAPEARAYLAELLHYEIGPRQRRAVETFWRLAVEEGLAPQPAQAPRWLPLEALAVASCPP